MIKKNVKVRYLYVIKTYLSSSMIVFFISGIYCLFKFQPMKLIISGFETHSLKPMKHRVSSMWDTESQVCETQSIKAWNSHYRILVVIESLLSWISSRRVVGWRKGRCGGVIAVSCGRNYTQLEVQTFAWKKAYAVICIERQCVENH